MNLVVLWAFSLPETYVSQIQSRNKQMMNQLLNRQTINEWPLLETDHCFSHLFKQWMPSICQFQTQIWEMNAFWMQSRMKQADWDELWQIMESSNDRKWSSVTVLITNEIFQTKMSNIPCLQCVKCKYLLLCSVLNHCHWISSVRQSKIFEYVTVGS